MRHIDLNQVRRFAKTELISLKEAAQVVDAEADDAVRRKYITDNASRCSDMAHALWLIGFGKCWYSEVVLTADEGEVEHFRPKKQVWKSTPPHLGYWWRAFDWRNLRLAHPLVNKRRKSYSTQRKAGKGCYFPLRREDARATTLATEQHEEPVLLDPTVPKDCRLICFDPSSGTPMPRFEPTDDPDGWRHARAKATIDFYHLNDGTWNGRREDLMREVAILCKRVLEAAARKDTAEYEVLLDELASYVHPFAEFSSAATQVVRDKGLLDHLHPPSPQRPGQPPPDNGGAPQPVAKPADNVKVSDSGGQG